MNCLDFEDVKEKHIPKLKSMAFAEMVKNKGAGSNNDSPSNSLENSNAEVVVNQEQNYNSR